MSRERGAAANLERLLTDADYAEYEYEQGNVSLGAVTDAKVALNKAMRDALPGLLANEARLAEAERLLWDLVEQMEARPKRVPEARWLTAEARRFLDAPEAQK